MGIPAFSSPEAIWGIEDLLVFSAAIVSVALVSKALENRLQSRHVVVRGWYLFLVFSGFVLSALFVVALFGGWRVGMAAGKSMMPTLPESSALVVNSHSYGLRRPFSGWWRTPRVPSSGDVAMFHVHIDGKSLLLAKRVVGLPGDRVGYRDGELFVNAVRVSGPAVQSPPRYAGGVRVDSSTAYLANAAPFSVLSPQAGQSNLFFEGVVPEKHVFVVGDNWAESYDSRDFGPIPLDSLRGKVRWAWSEKTGWISL